MYTFLYKYCWQYLYTSIAIIHFKRSHIENKFRHLDKFTFNLSIFFNEMFSLRNPFSNWIVNIRLSIIYLLYACRVQSVVPPLRYTYILVNIGKVSFSSWENRSTHCRMKLFRVHTITRENRKQIILWLRVE